MSDMKPYRHKVTGIVADVHEYAAAAMSDVLEPVVPEPLVTEVASTGGAKPRVTKKETKDD